MPDPVTPPATPGPAPAPEADDKQQPLNQNGE